MSKDEPQFGVSPVELAHSNQTSNTDLREVPTVVELRGITTHLVPEDPGNPELEQKRDTVVNELMQLIEADKALAELYGRLHQTIELFQSGMLSAENYSKIHGELTERISKLQGGKRDE